MKKYPTQCFLVTILCGLIPIGCATQSSPSRILTIDRTPVPTIDTTGPLLAASRLTDTYSNPVTVPGTTSTFSVYLPPVPSGLLNSNGKLSMKFEAFIVTIESSFGKLKVSPQSGGPHSSIFTQASGLFSGNETIELTPATGSEDVHKNDIQFKLKSTGGLTEDELMVILGRAPASGEASPVYELGLFYTVDVP